MLEGVVGEDLDDEVVAGDGIDDCVEVEGEVLGVVLSVGVGVDVVVDCGVGDWLGEEDCVDVVAGGEVGDCNEVGAGVGIGVVKLGA